LPAMDETKLSHASQSPSCAALFFGMLASNAVAFA